MRLITSIAALPLFLAACVAPEESELGSIAEPIELGSDYVVAFQLKTGTKASGLLRADHSVELCDVRLESVEGYQPYFQNGVSAHSSVQDLDADVVGSELLVKQGSVALHMGLDAATYEKNGGFPADGSKIPGVILAVDVPFTKLQTKAAFRVELAAPSPAGPSRLDVTILGHFYEGIMAFGVGKTAEELNAKHGYSNDPEAHYLARTTAAALPGDPATCASVKKRFDLSRLAIP